MVPIHRVELCGEAYETSCVTARQPAYLFGTVGKDSNPRSPETCGLQPRTFVHFVLLLHCLATLEGLEPSTLGVENLRSYPLSYRAVLC